MAGISEGETAYHAKDYQTAMSEFRALAKIEDAVAQNYLGSMYEVGQGVPQDGKQAVKWYRLAGQQGNATAQNNLGAKYEDGQGVEPNRVIACALYNLSARSDSTNQGIAATNRSKLSKSMSPAEIRTAMALSGELAKVDNFLKTLDRSTPSSHVKEKAKATVQKDQSKPS